MSDEYRVTILLEKNGTAVAGMPLIRRLIVNEDADITQVATPDNSPIPFHAIQAAIMPTMQVFLLTTDQAINLNINQNTPFNLNANGLVLLFGTTLSQGAAQNNVTFNNPALTGGVSANLTGNIAGT